MPLLPRFLAVSLLLAGATASCNPSASPEASAPAATPASQHNQQIAKNMATDYALLQVFETGDVSKLDSIIAPNFVNHAGPGDQQGLAAQKAMVQGFHKHMPDVKLEVKKRWADDDYVSDWIVYTGKAMVIEGIELTRYANGKAVEHWFFPSSQPKRS